MPDLEQNGATLIGVPSDPELRGRKTTGGRLRDLKAGGLVQQSLSGPGRLSQSAVLDHQAKVLDDLDAVLR
jgi:hypothetical protein